eukprot:CAMPEP_0178627042 /NCGR_PEP_ID=MMETSP0698-20121128/8709_1 /TAXON_ID=265572 /ORGANISM="Extubocellulus spinifer, Strain CCMP396" /LENGTH=474 /DNA_ID=CAMNT_0020266263 /DNA_START=92 /DNA_END=1512 /DNA_ORIENTATION=+
MVFGEIISAASRLVYRHASPQTEAVAGARARVDSDADNSGIVPPSSDPVFWKPAPLGTFAKYDDIDEKMQQYASSAGFKLRKSNHFLTEDESRTVFGSERRVERRGYWQCTEKDCPFHVAYTCFKKDRLYRFKDEKFCLDHNHELNTSLLQHDGYTLVNSERDLTPKEVTAIEDVAPAGMGMQKLKDYLERHFPDRKFTSTLLHRVKKKALKHRYGDDQHQLNQLMVDGFKMKEDGGAFDFKLDDSARLKSVHWQSATMKQYVETYGYFVIADGTHGTNIYGLQLLVYFVVDCFGKTCFAGYSATRSENTDDVDDGMEELGLKKKKPSLMSDEGPAFIAMAIKNGLVHKLCGHHYTKNGIKCVAGLADLYRPFLNDINAAVYDDVPNKKLDDMLDKAAKKYGGHPKAFEYITKLRNDKEKVCYSYAGNTFSAGAKTSQRAESGMSKIKGGGTLKKDMKKFNLHHLDARIRSLAA